jgi:hypothetical protein
MTNRMRVAVVVSRILRGDLCFVDDHSRDRSVQTLMQKSGCGQERTAAL